MPPREVWLHRTDPRRAVLAERPEQRNARPVEALLARPTAKPAGTPGSDSTHTAATDLTPAPGLFGPDPGRPLRQASVAVAARRVARTAGPIGEWSICGRCEFAYLESFLPTIELDLAESRRMLCFHGSPQANSDRLLATTPEEELVRLFAGATADVLAGGHTHLQFERRLGGSPLVNPGSVGLPLHADSDARSLPARTPRLPRFAEYALVEADEAIGVELRRVPIDVAALERVGLRSSMPYPDWWAAGLARRIARRNALAAPDRTDVKDADLLASS